MNKWSIALKDIDTNLLDTPFKLELDGSDAPENLDAFVLVIDGARIQCDKNNSYCKEHPDFKGIFLIGYSNICTHMGCRLVQKKENNQVKLERDTQTGNLLCGPCPCHGTTFNLSKSGVVVLGPATQHLPQLILSITGTGENRLLTGYFPLANDDPREERWPIVPGGRNNG